MSANSQKRTLTVIRKRFTLQCVMVEPSENRILYIEDEEPLCDLFKVAIEAHGHSVDVAHNGEDGFALHAAQPYDLIATDYQLPDMTGVDIARKLLIDDPNIPIVMVTGKGSEQMAAEALALGVYNYVIKDSEKIYLELLPNVIDSALKRVAERYDKGTVFDVGPITWARLQRNFLVVYRMEVDENGVIELHVYQRMLTAKGLELFFTATRDNKPIRSVRGRYRKR